MTYLPSKPSAACKKSSKRSNSCSAVERDANGIASTSRSYSNPKKSLVKYGRLDEDPSSLQLGKVGFLVVSGRCRCCHNSLPYSIFVVVFFFFFFFILLFTSIFLDDIRSHVIFIESHVSQRFQNGRYRGGCPSASFLGDFLVVLTGDPSNTYVSLLRLLTASFNSSSAAIFATTAFQRSNSGTTFELFNVSYKLSNSFSLPRFSASSSKRRLELSETPLVTENSDTMFANTAADVSAYRFFLLLL